MKLKRNFEINIKQVAFQILVVSLGMIYLYWKHNDRIKEEFLALVAQRYEALQSLNKLDKSYDDEKEFVSICKELGREVLAVFLMQLYREIKQRG